MPAGRNLVLGQAVQKPHYSLHIAGAWEARLPRKAQPGELFGGITGKQIGKSGARQPRLNLAGIFDEKSLAASQTAPYSGLAVDLHGGVQPECRRATTRAEQHGGLANITSCHADEPVRCLLLNVFL